MFRAITAFAFVFLFFGNAVAEDITASQVDSMANYVIKNLEKIEGGVSTLELKVHGIGKQTTYTFQKAHSYGRVTGADLYYHPSSGKLLIVGDLPGIYYDFTTICLWDPNGKHRVLYYYNIPPDNLLNYYILNMFFDQPDELAEFLVDNLEPWHDSRPAISTILFPAENIKANSDGTLIHGWKNDYLVNFALAESLKIIIAGIK